MNPTPTQPHDVHTEPNHRLVESRRQGELVETVDGIVWELDVRTLRFTFVSRQAERLLGYPVEQWLRETDFWSNHLHPDDRGWAVDFCLGATRERRDHDFEYRMLAADGRVVWMRDIVTVISEGGEPALLRGIMVDVTERKRAEELLSGQLRVLEMVAAGAPLTESLTELIRFIEAQSPGILGSILALDEEGVRLSHVAAPSLPPEYTAAIDGVAIGPEVGSCGASAYRKVPVFVEDIASDPLWRDFKFAALPYGLRACWSTPILDARRRVLGTFALYYRLPALPSAEQKRLIEMAAHTAAIALGRHRTETALGASAERLRLAVRASNLGLWDWNIETNQVVFSKEWKSQLGYEESEIGSEYGEWEGRVHPDDLAPTLSELHACLGGKRTDFAVEYRMLHKDGSHRWIYSRGELLRGLDGEPGRMLGCHLDITERKRSEAEMHRSSDLLRAVSDGTPDAIFVKDLEGKYQFFNAAASSFVNKPISEVLGKDDTELFEPASARVVMDWDRNVMESGRAETIEETLTAAGVTRTYSATKAPYRDGAGNVIGLIGISRDITDRKRVEDALRRSEETLRRAQEIGRVGSWIFDVHEGVFHGSEEADRIYGWEPGPHSAEELFASVHADDLPNLRAAWRALLTGALFEQEHRLVVRGQIAWVSVRAEPETDAAGRLVHIAGVTQDITERRRLEEQFQQAQKMDAVGQLAGGIAHDFNNLLTVINGYCELLLRNASPGDASFGPLGEIRKAGERSAGLTRQLLAFSRRQVLAPRVLDLNAVVTDTEKLLRRLIGEDVRFSTRLGTALGAVRADPGQIEQVLLNLAVNARDAMATGGRMTIETRNADLGEEEIRTRPDAKAGPHVLLAVSDTGCGMEDAVRSRIFEPYFTTKGAGKGTGLGLAVVHGIVRQSGGWIEVTSELGNGTTFRVYLPRVERVVGEKRPESRLAAPPRGTETILLVEDEDGVRALMRHVLEGCGYTVLEAADGDEGLSVAADHAGPISLLVTDVVMPGPGGSQVAERIAVLRPQLRVLFVSGYTDDAVVRHGVLHEEVNFLQKPFSTAVLAQKVREVLDAVPRA